MRAAEVQEKPPWRRAKPIVCCLVVCVGLAGSIAGFLYYGGFIHGTDASCMQPGDLLFGISAGEKEDLGWVCCDNERLAEPRGWYLRETELEGVLRANASASAGAPFTFYDASCGLPLYRAPVGRSLEQFLAESRAHGWPSFREQEVVGGNVEVRGGGEVVSRCGTHLGHDLPDRKGTRHCINLLCVAGRSAP